MKNGKKFILIGIGIAFLIGLGIFFYLTLSDKNRLTIVEKEWINKNKDSVINVAVVNDINNFGKDGNGVYFEFLNDFADEYGFTINSVPFNYGTESSGLRLSIKHTLDDTDQTFYKDHYVLVSKEDEVITDLDSLSDGKIAILSSDEDSVNEYLPGLTFVTYDNRVSLMDGVLSNTEVTYAIVPLNMFIDQILTNNYYIVYHFSEIPIYYTLSFPNDDTFASIMTKYSNNWIKSNLEESLNQNNLDLFLENLDIQEKDKDVLTSKVYNYGAILSTPFEVISSNNFGGIASVYLQKFSDFSGVEFKYLNYKKVSNLQKAIKNNDIDLYFNYQNVESAYTDINTLINTTIDIIAPKDNYIVIDSFESLKGKTVYALENSNVYYYLNNLSGIDVKTYANDRELLKLKNKDVLIAMDNTTFEYYINYGLDNFSLRYSKEISSPYTFKLNGDATLNKLFSKYIGSLDPKEVEYEGLASFTEIRQNSLLLSRLAIYALIVISLGIGALIIIIKRRKKLKISKKISKEDRMKYIDVLTSLKNRNYLSDNVEGWNKNTIYPQAAIVVDLNNVKYINDTYGTTEGDKQIKAAANILIKTQLDNSDMIRTDGNEYLIYLIGYEEKRIVSYIRKLYKEFNHLPYEYGAAIGYSMRTDDIKTIDDAINEATLDMRSKKESRETKV